jgi:hypothetical protein
LREREENMVYFDCELKSNFNIPMKELLGDLVRVRPVSRYGKNHEVETRSISCIDLSDFGKTDKPDKYRITDFGIHSSDSSADKGIEKKRAEGLVFAGYDDEGYARFEKEWDKAVFDSLNYEPCSYSSDERALLWGGNYRYSEEIGFAVSRRYPELEFHFLSWCEGELLDDYVLKNGVISGKE